MCSFGEKLDDILLCHCIRISAFRTSAAVRCCVKGIRNGSDVLQRRCTGKDSRFGFEFYFGFLRRIISFCLGVEIYLFLLLEMTTTLTHGGALDIDFLS